MDAVHALAAGSVGCVDPVPSTKQLLRWSEALAGIARTGLGFTESLYEQERFEEILRVAADIRVAVDDGIRGRRGCRRAGRGVAGLGRQGRPRLRDPQGGGRRRGGQRQGRDAAGQAGRLGRLALPHRLGRRRLLGRRGGGQGGRGGDRHRGRGGPADRRARRAADRHQPHPALLAGVPVPGRSAESSRPTPSSAPTSAGSPSTSSPSRWPGPSGGGSTSSPRCAASPSRCSTTRSARRSGGATRTSLRATGRSTPRHHPGRRPMLATLPPVTPRTGRASRLRGDRSASRGDRVTRPPR